MKRELTLADVVGYLPHRLVCRHPEGRTTVWVGIKGFQYPEMPDIGKPVLRPMSDLYVEITERGYNGGKPFVPIMKLAELIGDIDDCGWAFQPENTRVFSRQFSWCFRWDFDSIAFRLYDSPQEIALGNVIPATHNLYDLLHRLKFDYRGLIDVKLAVSVHDLPTNPYEQ